jgi:Type II secretion system (T2SS), protein M
MTGRDRMVAIGIAVVVIVAAGWMLVVSPERKKANELQTQVEKAQTTLSTAQTELSHAQASESQYASAYSSVVSLGKAVPASQEVPSLIYQLAQVTGERHVDFGSIASSATSTSSAAAATTPASAATAGFTQMPFDFVFSGGFFNLEQLFRQLTDFTTHGSDGNLQVSGRLLTIQSIKLSPEGTTGTTQNLEGTITATAYVLPASQGLTAGATPTSPTGATTPAAASTTSPTSAPAVVKVTP